MTWPPISAAEVDGATLSALNVIQALAPDRRAQLLGDIGRLLFTLNALSIEVQRGQLSAAHRSSGASAT